MIDLYYWPTPNGHKIPIMLEECGLEYQVHPINMLKGDQFKPKYLKLNPNNKIPTIVDRDGPGGKPFTVFESGAILIYLAEKTGKFMPKDPAGRSEVIGQTIRLDEQSYTVVGVVHDTQRSGSYVYLPCAPAWEDQNFKQRILWADGRLKPDVTLAQAQSWARAGVAKRRRAPEKEGQLALHIRCSLTEARDYNVFWRG